MSVLEIRDLNAHLGDAHILQGVSLSVGEGEVVGLLGRNGAGKSTTLKTVVGWIRATSGSIVYRGRSIAGVSTARIARSGVAFIPEDRRIFPALSVEENLRLGLFQSGLVSAAVARARFAEVYDWFPRLAERRRQAGRTLSGGEQQMLAIARGLIGKPRLLLVDEPTEGLAPLVVREIFDAIQRMKREGISVLLVEQNVRGALKVCDRCTILDRGVTIAEGDAATIAENEAIRQKLAV